jgi:hypothetical protein
MIRKIIQNYYIEIVIGTQFVNSFIIQFQGKISSGMEKKIQNEFETLALCLTYYSFILYYLHAC